MDIFSSMLKCYLSNVEQMRVRFQKDLKGKPGEIITKLKLLQADLIILFYSYQKRRLANNLIGKTLDNVISSIDELIEILRKTGLTKEVEDIRDIKGFINGLIYALENR